LAIERRHADVVIEDVDLLHIVAVITPLDLVGVDVEIEPFRVLRRGHVDVPHRRREAQSNEDCQQCERDARPRKDGLIQEPIESV
jgi:hypothetical protein